MYYIVFDLEFNMPYKIDPQTKQIVKGESNSLMPVEILEIGAVKLNDKLEIIDTFEMLVKPNLYKRINPSTKRITKITEEYLVNALSFKEVIKKFFIWCGNKVIFCSWGKDDIIILKRSCDFYKVDILNLDYIDIQNIYMNKYNINQASLKEVIKTFEIENDKQFHCALNDANYTAQIIQKFDKDELILYNKKIEDVYNSSLRIDSLDDERIDKVKIICKCPQCGNTAETIRDWRFYKKYFWSIGKCNACQDIIYYKLKIQIDDSENNELIYKMNTKIRKLKSDIKELG